MLAGHCSKSKVIFEMDEIKEVVEEEKYLGHSMEFGEAEVRTQLSTFLVHHFEHFSSND